ncbi:MAG: hypothetical protein ACE15D_01590 [Candidatus Eisenbacteria bacterium]
MPRTGPGGGRLSPLALLARRALLARLALIVLPGLLVLLALLSGVAPGERFPIGRAAHAQGEPREESPAPSTLADPTLSRSSELLIVPGDGRPAQPVPRYERDGVEFVPLASLARALGLPYSWDPYSYRGWVQVDTTRIGFVLDSPVLLRGVRAAQLDAPVSYGGPGVLMPVDLLALLSRDWSDLRPASWAPSEGRFVWGGPSPHFRELRLAEVGHRGVLRISGPAPRRSSILWAAGSGLEVILDGISPHPESLAIAGPRSILSIREVEGWANGTRIALDVGPTAVGVSSRYDDHEQAWELEVTESQQEVDRGSFRPLRPLAADGFGLRRGPILLTCLIDRASDPAEGGYALLDLADRVVRILADTLGQPASFMQAIDPGSDASNAAMLEARCVIALRLDNYEHAPDQIQIWTPAPRLKWELLDETPGRTYAVAPRPLLWSEAPILSRGESDRLARTLFAHLETFLGQGKVQLGSRPSRWMEGFTMPALTIYPAFVRDPFSLGRLLDPGQRAGLAQAIAFGVGEALASISTEEFPAPSRGLPAGNGAPRQHPEGDLP